MRSADEKRRYPWWQLILLGLAGLLEATGHAIARPLHRMWDSDDPLDTYGLVHLSSAAGDALVAIALADSVFFSLPVKEAAPRVALYLAITMAPLAVAGPLLVPLLDRAGPRRAISIAAAAGRALAAVYAAPRFSTLLLFPSAFVLLVLAKINTITRNGLTVAYAPPNEGLVRANARYGRLGVVGALSAAVIGIPLLKLGEGGAPRVLYAAAVLYGACTLLNLRLPHPRMPDTIGEVRRRGRVPVLAGPATLTAGLRAAGGFLLFLLAFALRRDMEPTYWFAVLAAAATGGGFLGDLVAPRLPTTLREEAVVIGCVAGAGVAALIAFEAFGLPVLAIFALIVGMSMEFGRLAFQSLMQRSAPGGAYGRVFVRYEVLFQVSWVIGALLPALLPIDFRGGILLLAGLYLLIGVLYLAQPYLLRRLESRPHRPAP